MFLSKKICFCTSLSVFRAHGKKDVMATHGETPVSICVKGTTMWCFGQILFPSQALSGLGMPSQLLWFRVRERLPDDAPSAQNEMLLFPVVWILMEQ